MRTIAILQARLGSTRLPGKVLLPLAGKSMLQNIIERVQRATTIHAVRLTYPVADQAEFILIVEACRARTGQGFATRDVQGYAWWDDPRDLVGRYAETAMLSDADIIVRIPCDNPCIDPVFIDEAVRQYQQFPFVFYSNTTASVDGFAIDGIGAEVLSVSRLRWLDEKTRDVPEFREHPHKYFEATGLLDLPKADLRLDVNTHADYEFISAIYDHFGHNRFTTEEVLHCPAVQVRLANAGNHHVHGV